MSCFLSFASRPISLCSQAKATVFQQLSQGSRLYGCNDLSIYSEKPSVLSLNRFTEIVAQSASIWLPSPLQFELVLWSKHWFVMEFGHLWACCGAKQRLWFHPLWVGVTWVMARKHQTARTFRTISIKVQSCALRNFAWIRNVALGNWRIQSSIMVNACWLCYVFLLCLPMSLIHLKRSDFSICNLWRWQGLILNSRLRVQSLLIHFDMSENWHNM